jgi:hypothetical protein
VHLRVALFLLLRLAVPMTVSASSTLHAQQGYSFFLPHNSVTLEWASLLYAARNCHTAYAILGPNPDSDLEQLDPSSLQELAVTVGQHACGPGPVRTLLDARLDGRFWYVYDGRAWLSANPY